jgi:hypothetical protein
MSSGRKFSALLLGCAMMLSGAGVLQAHAESCEKRVHKAEHNLSEAVRKHGEHSRQAEQRRHQLEEARQHCH